MTAADRTAEPDATFAPLLESWEAREAVDAAEDARVEVVARAMYAAAGDDAPSWRTPWGELPEHRQDTWRRLALAAIHALSTPQVDTAAAAEDIRDDKGYYHGKVGTDSEHRTVGDYRAWCYDCGEWCYPSAPCGEPKCCGESRWTADAPDPSFRDTLAEALAKAWKFPESALFDPKWIAHLRITGSTAEIVDALMPAIAAEVEARVQVAANQRAAEVETATRDHFGRAYAPPGGPIDAVTKLAQASFRAGYVIALAQPAPATDEEGRA